MKKIYCILLSLSLITPSFAQEEAILSALVGAQKSQSEPEKKETQNPKAQNPAEETATAKPPKRGSDPEIKERISAVFAEIDDLQAINVAVQGGVVSLTGEIANDKAGEKAIRMAQRFSGVQSVEDKMTRTLAIDDNVHSLVKDLLQKGREFVRFLPMLFIGFLVFTLFRLFGKFLANRRALWGRLSSNPFVAELVSHSIRALFFLIGIVVALNFIGAQKLLTTVLGGAGVLGFAVGFAVKDSIENYLASVMLSTRQPFRAGDYVVINSTKEGIVMRLTSRATILMTLEGNQLRVPNSEVFKGVILNYTTNPERRIDFDLLVEFTHSLLACKVALDTINAQDYVLTKPTPTATTQTEGSSVRMTVRFWVNQNDTNIEKARTLAIGTLIEVLNAKNLLVSATKSIAIVQQDKSEGLTPATSVQKLKDALPDEEPHTLPTSAETGKNLLDDKSPRE